MYLDFAEHFFFSKTFVNKGQKEGPRLLLAQALLFASELLRLLWGNPLGRRSQFEPRRHLLGAYDLDPREHAAVWGDEQIELRTIRIGGGPCAIRPDGIRAGGVPLTNNVPVKVK